MTVHTVLEPRRDSKNFFCFLFCPLLHFQSVSRDHPSELLAAYNSTLSQLHRSAITSIPLACPSTTRGHHGENNYSRSFTRPDLQASLPTPTHHSRGSSTFPLCQWRSTMNTFHFRRMQEQPDFSQPSTLTPQAALQLTSSRGNAAEMHLPKTMQSPIFNKA